MWLWKPSRKGARYIDAELKRLQDPPPIFKLHWVTYTIGLLVITSLAGFIMRLMPLVPVPSLNFEYLLHGHSHLAFLAWVYNALFIGLFYAFLSKQTNLLRKYQTLFWITQISTVGMFIAFILDGYQLPAITMLAIHTFMTYLFVIYFLIDSKGTTPALSGNILKWAFTWLFISSLGPMAIPIIQNTTANASHMKLAVNFYLHFQYNGWFVFGILAIIVKNLPETVRNRSLFYICYLLLLISIIPAYFFSIQWISLQPWLYWMAGVAGLVQFLGVSGIGWILYLNRQQWNSSFGKGLSKWILLAWVIFMLKCLFQALSVIPVIYQMVFHSRNVMIAYLHWHFLGFVSLSLIVILARKIPNPGRLFTGGLALFFFGFLIQELYLFAQGILSRFGIIFMDRQFEILLLSALMLFLGSVSIFAVGVKRIKQSQYLNDNL